MPLVQTVVRLQTTFKLLQVTGVSALVSMIMKIAIFKSAILAAWQRAQMAFQKITQGIGIVIAAIGKLIASIGAAMRAFIQMGVVSGRVSKQQAKQLKATSLQLTAFTAARGGGPAASGTDQNPNLIHSIYG